MFLISKIPTLYIHYLFFYVIKDVEILDLYFNENSILLFREKIGMVSGERTNYFYSELCVRRMCYFP